MRETSYDDNDKKYQTTSRYVGVPFEVAINWFKPEKRRVKIYGLIPVGPATALGGSIGFKFFGNVSQNSYAGLGLTYGFGYHRKYPSAQVIQKNKE